MLTDEQKQERDEQIILLTLDNWSARQICNELRVSTRTVQKVRNSNGIHDQYHRKKEKDTQYRDRQIIRLTKLKVTTKQIAELLNCSERTVSRVRRDNECMVVPAAKPYTEQELLIAKEVLDAGGSYAEAARTISGPGASGQSLKAKLPGYRTWTRKESRDYAALVRKLNKLSNYPTTPRPGIIGKGPSF